MDIKKSMKPPAISDFYGSLWLRCDCSCGKQALQWFVIVNIFLKCNLWKVMVNVSVMMVARSFLIVSFFYVPFLNHYLHQGDHVLVKHWFVCLSVFLSVFFFCWQHYSEIYKLIAIKCYGGVRNGKSNNCK